MNEFQCSQNLSKIIDGLIRIVIRIREGTDTNCLNVAQKLLDIRDLVNENAYGKAAELLKSLVDRDPENLGTFTTRGLFQDSLRELLHHLLKADEFFRA